MRLGQEVQALPRAAELRRPGDSFQIRRAVEADRDAIEELQARAVRAIVDSPYTTEEIETVLLRMARLDPKLVAAGTYNLAESGGRKPRLVGTGGWSPARFEEGCAEIRAVFTDPDFAGRGIGRLLVADAIRSARGAGFRDIRVRSSLNAVAFYERLGFRPLREMNLDVGARLPLRTLYMELAETG